MPWLQQDTSFILQIYNRCEARGALPEDGGLFDQPEEIMRYFDIIDSEVSRYKKQLTNEQSADVEKQRMLRDLNVRSH